MDLQTESQFELPKVNVSSKKSEVRCPKCGATGITRTVSTRKFKVFECSSCGYAWREERVARPPSRFRCVFWMVVVVCAYVVGLEFVPSLGSTWVETLVVLGVFAVPHEFLHALARRFFGYRAIPIPILFPPILGITLGPKPQRMSEKVAVGFAPVLMTAANFLVFYLTGNGRYLMLRLLNLFCTAFDVLPLVLPQRKRRANLIFLKV